MAVSFKPLKVGNAYSRHDLAELWGYDSFNALARGVVTPANDNKVILFVTEDKQSSAREYKDVLDGDHLHWEGPDDHFAEERMTARPLAHEIHLFWRDRHHKDFTYCGRLEVIHVQRHTDRPSRFEFRLLDWSRN